MSEKPIIFTAESVRAILERRKTQTRRLIKNPEYHRCLIGNCPHWHKDDCAKSLAEHAPYQVGQRLWVKETWADTNGESGPMLSYKAGGDKFLMDCPEFLEPDGSMDYTKIPGCQFTMWCGDLRRGEEGHSWRSPMFMPRRASRIDLKVTSVRAEKVQDIEGEDAFAEGVPCSSWDEEDWIDSDGYGTVMENRYRQAIAEYKDIWNSLHAKPKPVKVQGIVTHYESHPWESGNETREYRGKPWYVKGNPFVWVIGFEVKNNV